MISAKAAKYTYRSSNSPGQLVASEELLFKSAVMLVDGRNRKEIQAYKFRAALKRLWEFT